MKSCTCCGESKPTSEFPFQKRNPNKRYAWCNSCRLDPESKRVGQTRTQNYFTEVQALREKAVQLRKLSPEQVVEAKTSRANGERVADIAQRLGVSERLLYKVTTNGYK